MKSNNKSPSLKEWWVAAKDAAKMVAQTGALRAVFGVVLIAGLAFSMFRWGVLVERCKPQPVQQPQAVSQEHAVTTERTQESANTEPEQEPDDDLAVQASTPPQEQPADEQAEAESDAESHAESEALNAAVPVMGKTITGYDWVYSAAFGDWRFHNGVDISAEPGAQVKAALSGRVASIEDDPIYGRVMKIEHDGGLSTIYASLEGIGVLVGENVLKNQVVGFVGESGPLEAEFGPHLHFELHKDGVPLDPTDHLNLQSIR